MIVGNVHRTMDHPASIMSIAAALSRVESARKDSIMRTHLIIAQIFIGLGNKAMGLVALRRALAECNRVNHPAKRHIFAALNYARCI